eukprot:gene197-424_t
MAQSPRSRYSEFQPEIQRHERVDVFKMNNSVSSNEAPKNSSEPAIIPGLDLNVLPECPLVLGYGSGVFSQPGAGKPEMVDLICVVDDLEQFHRENIQRNPGHYSGLRYFGAGAVGSVNRYGPGVYYNPSVQIGDVNAKYGVVAWPSFTADLLEWPFLYLAGRLHKPIKRLRGEAAVFQQQIDRNREHAIRAALLTIPERKSSGSGDEVLLLDDLFLTIIGLSYGGDIRSQGFESPEKKNRILLGARDELKQIYNPLLKEKFGWHLRSDSESISLDRSSQEARFALLNGLPTSLRVQASAGKLSEALAARVKRSSVQMAGKGLFSAGLKRSLLYALAKRAKAR